MLVLGWFAVLLGVLATLWADGAFAKIDWRSVRTCFPNHAPTKRVLSEAPRGKANSHAPPRLVRSRIWDAGRDNVTGHSSQVR